MRLAMLTVAALLTDAPILILWGLVKLLAVLTILGLDGLAWLR